MTSAALAGLLLRQPFQPFTFVLAHHIELRIERAEWVKHKPGDRIVTITWPEGSESIIDLDRVALITVSKPKPRPWPDEARP